MLTRRIPRLTALVAALVATLAGSHVGAQTAGRAAAAPRDTIRISIEDAVTRAIRSGDEVALASAQIDLAEAQITSARAAGLPQLAINGSYQQVIENARATIVGSVFGQAFTYQANARLSQSLFQGGRVLAGTRAAASVRGAARQNRNDVEARLSVGVQRAYLQTLLAEQLVDIQERNLALANERVAQVERLEQAGRAARYDVLRARVERANLEPAVIAARSQRELAALALKRLLDVPADRPVALTSALDTSRVSAVAQSIAGDSAIDRTPPAVRAAELALEARRQGVRVARADFLPTVNAFVQSGYLALPASNGFPTSFGRASNTLCPDGSPATRICQNNGWFADRNFGLQVSWPIFDGLRTKGNVDLAQAQTRVADLQLRQERELAELERATARSELVRAEASFAASRQNATEAEEAFRLATLRFERGLGTQLEVSDAQLALLTARSNEARAVYDLYLAAAELARARGVAVPLPPTRPVQ